jgi:hypothetical protein
MEAAQLTVVSRTPEEAADRVQRLFAEARAAAREHMALLEQVVRAELKLAREIADGGDPYPAGVRELCRRSADDAAARLQNLQALIHRSVGS